MNIAPPVPPKKAGHTPEAKPLTALMAKFCLDAEDVAVLIGLDRRTVTRWAKAELAGEESPVPLPHRYAFDVYREGYVSERLDYLLWLRKIKEGADELYPVEGEEDWILREAESTGVNVRVGPWITVPPLMEMAVGIRFCRSRLTVARAVQQSLGDALNDQELKRVSRIVENYRRVVDDYAERFKKKPARGRTKKLTDGSSL